MISIYFILKLFSIKRTIRSNIRTMRNVSLLLKKIINNSLVDQISVNGEKSREATTNVNNLEEGEIPRQSAKGHE